MVHDPVAYSELNSSRFVICRTWRGDYGVAYCNENESTYRINRSNGDCLDERVN